MKSNKIFIKSKYKMRGVALIEVLVASAILGITFGVFIFKAAELQKHFNLAQTKISQSFAMIQALNSISATNSNLAIEHINNNQTKENAKISGQCSINSCEISAIAKQNKNLMNVALENLENVAEKKL